MRIFSSTLPVLLLVLSATAAGAPTIVPMWSVNTYTFLESGLTLADLNNDGVEEIVTPGREELIAIDGAGKELWRWLAPGRLMTYPEVLAVSNQSPLIYAADNAGHFSCVDVAGKLVWQAKLNAPSSWSGATVCDLDKDGHPEVLQTDESGALWLFDAMTGAVKWRASLKGAPVTPAAFDGGIIAVATGAGLLYALRADGSVQWEKQIGGTSPTWATSSPVIFAAPDGTPRIVAAPAEGRILCMNAAGEVLWSRATRGAVASSISVGDLDRDSRPEIFCITQTGVIYRFDQAGRMLWEIDMQGRTLAPGTVLDIDNDGRMEFVMSTQSGRMMIFNDQAQCVLQHIFDSRTINVTPAVGDIFKDTPGPEIALTGGESGLVYCFSTASKPETASATQTGDKPRMQPINLAAEQLTSGDPVRFSITGGDQPLRAFAACIWPDGSRQCALLPVLYSPVELLLPFEVNTSGDYTFEWSLESESGETSASGKQTLRMQPFTSDQMLAAQTITKLLNTAAAIQDKTPLTSRALRDYAETLDASARKTAQKQATAADASPDAFKTIVDESATLVREMRRADRIASVADAASRTTATPSLIAFEGDSDREGMWESREVDQRVPASCANPLGISRRAVPGEHEPVAVNIFNLIDRELRVRCVVDPAADGMAATLHRAQASPDTRGDVSWDALPLMDDSGVISIPPLETRQVWLDIDVQNAAPGPHIVTLRLQSLDGAGVLDSSRNPHDVPPTETVVEVRLNVLPFEMAAPNTMRLCAWATLGAPEIDDMLAHGNNVFCAPLPPATFDGEGKYTPDYTKLDAIVEMLKKHDVILLLQGIPQFADAEKAKTYFDDLAAHLAVAGIDEKHFALYPIDEPGGFGWAAVNQLIEFGKVVRAVRPTVQLYMDGGGELPMFQAMAPYIDIWTPGINMLCENTPEMKCIRDTGKILWSYNCSYSHSSGSRSSLKNSNVVAEYRIAALYALRWNATGIGFWCYNIGANPWSRTELDYPLVYPGRTRPVTSRRWEAVREGVEDARIAAALRDRIDTVTDAALQQKIRNLLDSSLPQMVDRSFSDMRLGLNRAAIDMSNNDRTMKAFRGEMLDCVEALSQK